MAQSTASRQLNELDDEETTEVQKNAIGEQVLGLPHDPSMPPR